MLGVIQEQHPDRAALFMQWKQMGWPILVDSLDLLGAEVVPQHIFIDEAGIVRAIGARMSDLEEFLSAPPAEATPAPKPSKPDLEALERAARSGKPSAILEFADALVMWGAPLDLDRAIESYTAAMRAGADVGSTNFRLGVAHRKRYESEFRMAGDFSKAIDHWAAALDADPNQYIWRRRIQQYGPRLDKPYPFYDWIAKARDEIRARGETPALILVEPGGAEIAQPSKELASVQSERAEPDADGRITRDPKNYVQVETIVAPSTDATQRAVRAHLVFRVNEKLKAHWNNEVEDMEVWLSLPEGWRADSRVQTASSPEVELSTEVREVEFELYSPPDAPPGETEIKGYALYYVCEDVDGVCMYLRRDISISVKVH